ncbi:MAG: VWA domain-containing protein, partial [Planctomycetota bacterium]
DATVDALIMNEGVIVASIPMTLRNAARGTYEGTAGELPVGKYDVRIRASGFDESALQATTPFWVVPPQPNENSRIRMDRDRLTQITAAGNGVFADEADAESVFEALEPLSSGRVVESDFLLWQSYLWFWPIIVLLAIEWWVRKRVGLV